MKMQKKENNTTKIIAEFGFKAKGTTCSVLFGIFVDRFPIWYVVY